MDPDDDPFTIAYRGRREARAQVVELLGLGGKAVDAVVSMAIERGVAKTLEQLANAPGELYCGHVSLADDDYRNRVEASLAKLTESSQALDRVAASHKPRESEYLEPARGERPGPSRSRSRDWSR